MREAQPELQPLTFLHGSTIIHAETPIPLQSEAAAPPSIMTTSPSSPETRLNQIVKGAPTTNISPPQSSPLQSLGKQSSEAQQASLDPHLSTLPSSPPQIYLNLLILESSLRAQYLHLIGRRRLNTFFLLLLAGWNGLFFYALFLRPREDGTGLGGSVYWVVETSEKLALMGGIVTVLLVWGTGQWERGIRWPRKWIGTTNRGLRTFNLRVVIMRKQFWREMLGNLSFLLPSALWREAGGSDWHLVEHENGLVIEEDLARGGDGIMLLLLPKSFSPEFRENWEEYRTEYWEKENERRAGLYRKLQVQRRTKAKETGGWRWWTGTWRLQPTRRHHSQNSQHAQHGARKHHSDLEKHPQGHHLPHHRSSMSTHSRSRQSSRSSTPHLPDFEPNPPLSTERMRRGSSVSSTASIRRKAGSLRDRDRAGGSKDISTTSTPLGTPLLSPLTSATAVASEDDREERRRRRREREAAKNKEREQHTDKDRDTPPHQHQHQHQHHHRRKTKSKHQDADPGNGNGNGKGYDAAGESSVPTTPMLGDGFSLGAALGGESAKDKADES